LIPTRNEEFAIGQTLSKIPREHTVFVADTSEDRTPQISAEYGAKVVRVEGLGKGRAVKRGLETIRDAVDEDALVVMVDGDGTYDPRDHTGMIRRLEVDVGMVVGNRFYHPERGSMSASHLVANRLLTWLANTRYGIGLRDALSGFRIFRLKAVNITALDSPGFDTEVDFLENILKQGFKVVDIPISYACRRDRSNSKIRIRDGFRILFRILFG
jgi:glycosyltransferase involved in cell wall biosynthesis